jgi:hypothetical protein
MTATADYAAVLAATRERALRWEGPIPLADSEFPDGVCADLGLDFRDDGTRGGKSASWAAWKVLAGQVASALEALSRDGTLIRTGADGPRGSVMFWSPEAYERRQRELSPEGRIAMEAGAMRDAPAGRRAMTLYNCAWRLARGGSSEEPSREALLAAAVERGLGRREASVQFGSGWAAGRKAAGT